MITSERNVSLKHCDRVKVYSCCLVRAVFPVQMHVPGALISLVRAALERAESWWHEGKHAPVKKEMLALVNRDVIKLSIGERLLQQ